MAMLYTEMRVAVFTLVMFSTLLIMISLSDNTVNTLKAMHRQLLNVTPFESNQEIISKCSRKADARGHHQRVVAFSLFGKLSDPSVSFRYVLPLVKNAQSLPSNYPGWVMRIYHNITPDDEASWEILNKNFGDDSQFWRQVDLCYVNDVTERQQFSMTWRFLPLLDDLVDVFMSRDSDSLITQRETDAVNEWLESNMTYHVMRDHPHHCVAVLGGLWGAKISNQRAKTKWIGRQIFSKSKHVHRPGFDQDTLRRYLWPFAKASMMSHDSYCCHRFNNSQVKPFPKRRNGYEFVGKVANWFSNDNQFPLIECPYKCRPPQHQDWKFC